MARKKRSRKEDYQIALNEIDDIKANKQRDLMNMNFKIRAKFKNKKQSDLADLINENRITIVTGSPGSGKSFIALKTSLELLKSNDSEIGGIILATQIRESKAIGALPGNLDEKSGASFSPQINTIDMLVGQDVRKFLKGADLITEELIHYMRGTSFSKHDDDGNNIPSIAILDETQNISPKDVLTFLTRLSGGKLILMGDLEQCDLKLRSGEKNGLEDVMERLNGLDGVGFMHFTEDDIVRDPFIKEIMKRYKV